MRVTHNGVTIRCRTNETVSGCRAVARNGSKTSLPEPWPYGQPPRCSKSLPDTFAFVRWRVWRGFRWGLLTATGDQRGFRSRARVCCACTERAPAFVRVISPKAFGNDAHTRLQMGHWRDSTVLFGHYRRAVTRRNAERYWNIRPVAVTKIVPMTSISR